MARNGRLALLIVLLLVPRLAAGAELKPVTRAAWEQHTAEVRQRFTATSGGPFWVEQATEQERARLRAGTIVAWPAAGDGILHIPGGLIHEWRAAAFIPGASLAKVLNVTQDYAHYSGTYDWTIRSGVLAHHRERDGDVFRVYLRLKESASVVTAVLDLWTVVEYRYPQTGRAIAVSHADCIREVEHAGQDDERRLPAGTGSGFLWRADTFSTYLERDGGVYADFETIGLSRPFPRLLGWIVEPIARRLGRGSAAESLRHLRQAVIAPRTVPATPPEEIPSAWCSS